MVGALNQTNPCYKTKPTKPTKPKSNISTNTEIPKQIRIYKYPNRTLKLRKRWSRGGETMTPWDHKSERSWRWDRNSMKSWEWEKVEPWRWSYRGETVGVLNREIVGVLDRETPECDYETVRRQSTRLWFVGERDRDRRRSRSRPMRVRVRVRRRGRKGWNEWKV